MKANDGMKDVKKERLNTCKSKQEEKKHMLEMMK